MSHIDIECEVLLDGERLDCVIVGECMKTQSGPLIRCQVLKVLHNGVDRVGDVPQEDMPALEWRLKNAILSARVRDAHAESEGA